MGWRFGPGGRACSLLPLFVLLSEAAAAAPQAPQAESARDESNRKCYANIVRTAEDVRTTVLYSVRNSPERSNREMIRQLSGCLEIRECGTRPAVGIDTGHRIVGGHDAVPGAWPWQVSLQVYEIGLGYIHICGGSLVSNNSILTAAHCSRIATNPALWRVVMGLHHLARHSSYTIKRRVKTIMVHSYYDKTTYENDIAVYRLVRSIKYNDHVQPICLPDTTFLIKADVPCFITGWGNIKEKGKSKLTLQEAQVDIIPLSLCNEHDWYGGLITWNMVCAGSATGHVDSCQGDSGGPLVCYIQNRSRFYLAGVTSFGYGCGRPQRPGVYVRTPNYKKWIDKHLRGKSIIMKSQYLSIFLIIEWVVFHIGL